MKIQKTTKCTAHDCAYCLENFCHAAVIAVGDGTLPKCNTFCLSIMKDKNSASAAAAVTCKVSSCIYNAGLKCQAPEIFVGYKEQEPQCLTVQFSYATTEDAYELSASNITAGLEQQIPEIFIG